MVRYGAIVLVAWSMVGVPTLCVAGLLPHACAGETAPRVAPSDCCAHGAPDPVDDGNCRHESDCESDPCSTTAVRSERDLGVEPMSAPQPVVVPWCVLPAIASGVRFHHLPDVPSWSRHTMHPSDLPLLI